MLRNRYQNLLKFLHFINNATQPSDLADKLYKLRPILLADTWFHSWHSLYMDNFYNSVEQSEELLAVKVHTVGMLRLQQGKPSNIRSAKTGTPKMKTGDSLSVDNGKEIKRLILKFRYKAL